MEAKEPWIGVIMQRFTAAVAGSVLAVSVIAMPAAGGLGHTSVSLAATTPGARGPVTQVDTAADGTAANNEAPGIPEFSPDGTRVVFASQANNLVPGDTNHRVDIFVKNLVTGGITRVSTTSTGQQATGGELSGDEITSGWPDPSWSPDGRRIAFSSDADNLVPRDTNKVTDVFVKNLTTGITTRVSTSRRGRQAVTAPDIQYRYGSADPTWSPSGRWIAFTSDARNLVAHDTNGRRSGNPWTDTDAFVKNLTTGQVKRVSTSRSGRQANGSSRQPQWSPSGKRVMFSTDATNLVRKGGAGTFIKTLATGAIKRVTKGSGAVFSSNGKRIAFGTRDALVRRDRNRVSDVYVKSLHTGRVQRVSVAAKPHRERKLDPADVQTRDAVWSPDGRGVAFTSEGKTLIPGVGPSPALYLKTLKSGEVTLLSATRRGKPILGWSETVGWSPNGKQIVFRSWADNLPPGDSSSGYYHVYVKTLR